MNLRVLLIFIGWCSENNGQCVNGDAKGPSKMVCTPSQYFFAGPAEPRFAYQKFLK